MPEWKKVAGTPKIIEGLESLDLFFHEGELVYLSDGLTGALMGWGKTEPEALEMFLTVWKHADALCVGGKTAAFLSKHGLSPRYGGKP